MNDDFISPKLRTSSFLFFILFVIFSFVVVNIAIYNVFPNQNTIPHFGRNIIIAILVLICIRLSKGLLERDSFPPEALTLKINADTFKHFSLGALLALVIISLMGLLLWLFVPFYFQLQQTSVSFLLKEVHSYFWGNFMEELMFRGYPLIVLSSVFGWRKAVLVMALPFGFFHFLGLEWGISGLKMITTTSLFSLIFSYVFILTGNLWTSIGLHVIGNFFLHTITGLDGSQNSLLKPVFTGKWPEHYDPGFWVLVVVIIAFASFFYTLINKKKINPFVLDGLRFEVPIK